MSTTRSIVRVTAAIVTAALATIVTPHASEAQVQPDPVRVLVLGDSISAPDLWQDELRRLLAAGGVSAEVVSLGVAGGTCWQLATVTEFVLAAADPDLVVFECGTNDDPAATRYGESETGWSFRYVVETVRAHRPGAPIPIVPALIQYSDPAAAPSWLWQVNEPRTNDVLWTNMRHYMPPRTSSSWFAGIADLQRIPSTRTYLDPGGIHPTFEGHRVIGRIVYDEAARRMGWPVPTDPPLCGLTGHRPGHPAPPATPC